MPTQPDQSTTSRVPTHQLVAAMLKESEKISDLIFSPGRAPQIEVRGELRELRYRGLEQLSPRQTHEVLSLIHI